MKLNKLYDQGSRPISTGKLKPLRALHTQPIKLVVYEWSSALLREGKSYLEIGFPLRCFQRLSRINVATQLCPWQDNWITRDLPIPVLSY
jgi:hypothetical protein